MASRLLSFLDAKLKLGLTGWAQFNCSGCRCIPLIELKHHCFSQLSARQR